MHSKYFALAALFPLILAGCGSSGGGGSNIRPDTPDTPAVESSLNDVPAEYRDAVKAAKTFNPMAELGKDLMDEQGMVLKQITVNGQVLQDGNYSFSDLKNGLSDLAISVSYGLPSDSQNQTAKGNLFLYQQPYSVVIGSVFTEDSGVFIDSDGFGVHYVDDVQGLKTASAAIDTLTADNAVFTYSGTAFNGKGQGDLSYTVDFAARSGSGAVTGLAETGKIDLLPANIANLNNEIVKGMGIAGKAQFENAPGADINYELGFFGPKAEEIAGRLSFANDADNVNGMSEVGFGAKR